MAEFFLGILIILGIGVLLFMVVRGGGIGCCGGGYGDACGCVTPRPEEGDSPDLSGRSEKETESQSKTH